EMLGRYLFELGMYPHRGTLVAAGHQRDGRPEGAEPVEMLGPVPHMRVEDGADQRIAAHARVERMHQVANDPFGDAGGEARCFGVRIARHHAPLSGLWNSTTNALSGSRSSTWCSASG